MRHWEWRARRQRLRLRASVTSLGIRNGADQVRQGVRLFLALAVRVFLGTLVAIALVVAVEAIAAWLSHFFHWGSLFTPVSVNSYVAFVAAAVGAQATFLALFFTTVGVIASTAYSRVPGEIRQLFVRERTSTIYVWNVVTALIVGITLLTLPVVSAREFRGLTAVLFALLSVFSVLSLVVLGRRLFNFFDPSTLTERLYPQFMRALRSASAAGRHIPDKVQQSAAHDRAAVILRRYEQLVTLITAREVQDTTAPEKIAYQLLGCWSASAAIKSSIPTKSDWFHRTASHPNWLTMDHTRLDTALRTQSGVQPTLTPDPLWVERRFSLLIGALLPSLAANDDWSRLIGVLDSANEFVFALAARLELDEAFLLLRAIAGYRHTVLAQTQAEDDVSNGDENIFRLALVEREVLGFTSLWLGFARRFESLDPQALALSLDKAVEGPTNAYRARAPRELLGLLEDVASGIAFEQRTEHERITPAWWLHHLSARILARTLEDGVCSFLDEVESTLVTPLVDDPLTDPELSAVRIFDLLELLHKVEYHLPAVHRALDSLQSLRHEPTADELWPDASLPDDTPRALEEKLLTQLGLVALQLPFASHDTTKPDLFGQAYRRLFDATFHAILDGRDEIARVLFPITIATANRARMRLVQDLSDERVRERAIFGTEPLVDTMELSGYALLMSLVTDAGIWLEVHAVWDNILDAGAAPALAAQLTAVLTLQENVFALTSGGVARTGRQMELARVLRERGIQSWAGMWGEPHPEPHRNPIIAVFAPDDLMGVHHDLADLFVVEYLAQRPDLTALEISRGAEMLRESLDRERQPRGSPADDDSGIGDEA